MSKLDLSLYECIKKTNNLENNSLPQRLERVKHYIYWIHEKLLVLQYVKAYIIFKTEDISNC